MKQTPENCPRCGRLALYTVLAGEIPYRICALCGSHDARDPSMALPLLRQAQILHADPRPVQIPRKRYHWRKCPRCGATRTSRRIDGVIKAVCACGYVSGSDPDVYKRNRRQSRPKSARACPRCADVYRAVVTERGVTRVCDRCGFSGCRKASA